MCSRCFSNIIILNIYKIRDINPVLKMRKWVSKRSNVAPLAEGRNLSLTTVFAFAYVLRDSCALTRADFTEWSDKL